MKKNPLKLNISFCSIIFAVYVALTPVHQSLLLSSGGTVNKYIALLLMFAICITFLFSKKTFNIEKQLLNKILFFISYIVMSTLWAPSYNILNLSTTISHCILLLFCYSKNWSVEEFNFIKKSLILSSAYFAIILLISQLSDVVGRSTISFGMNDTESDQNILSLNISLAILFSLDFLLNEKNRLIRYFYAAIIFIILLGMLSTGSRGALLALIISVLIYSFNMPKTKKREKKSINRFLLLGSLFISLIFSLGNILSENVVSRYIEIEQLSGGSGRIEIWLDYLYALINWPIYLLIGYGYPYAPLLYGDFYNTNWPPATHNDYIYILCTTGFIGVILFTSFVGYIWTLCKRNDNYLGLGCITLALLGSMTLNYFVTYGWWNLMIFALIGSKLAVNKKAS